MTLITLITLTLSRSTLKSVPRCAEGMLWRFPLGL